MSAMSWPLQKALYAHLVSDTGLKSELGDPPRLYDDPPKDAAFPYVVIGEARAEPLAGLEGGFVHDIRLQIYSRHAGRRDVKRLIDLLYDALHEASFAVEGARLVDCRFVLGDVFRRDATGEAYHGVARFRVMTETA